MEAPRCDLGSQISLRTTDVGKGTASMHNAFWEGPRVPKKSLGLPLPPLWQGCFPTLPDALLAQTKHTSL